MKEISITKEEFRKYLPALSFERACNIWRMYETRESIEFDEELIESLERCIKTK